MVPIYAQAESIINLVQELYGLLSMPILSAFIVGLLFRGVSAGAAIVAVVLGGLTVRIFLLCLGAFPLHSYDVYHCYFLRIFRTAGQSFCVWCHTSMGPSHSF
jgi:uncharacterized sodium:solute symporter family permease YidK